MTDPLPTCHLALLDTAIGRCGLAWHQDAVVGFSLPCASDAATTSRLRRRFPGAEPAEPPAWIARVIARVQAHLAGTPDDLADVPVDLRREPDLHQRVYAITRAIPPGATLTYGEVARQLGDLQLARAVGQALGANPVPVIVPCHRVLAASGAMHGFSAPGGVETKYTLLAIEGAAAAAQLGLFGPG